MTPRVGVGSAPASPNPPGEAGAFQPFRFAVTVVHGRLAGTLDYCALGFLRDVALASVSVPGDRHTWVVDPERAERLQAVFRRHARPLWRLIVTVAG